jgi:hypothetical protein
LPFSKEEDYFHSNLFKGSFFSIGVWSDSMNHSQERRNRGRSLHDVLEFKVIQVCVVLWCGKTK